MNQPNAYKERQSCTDCIHHDACYDWVRAIWDGLAEDIMEGETKNCAHFTMVVDNCSDLQKATIGEEFRRCRA